MSAKKTPLANHGWARKLMHNKASGLDVFIQGFKENRLASIDAQDSGGYTLLHFAATYDRGDIKDWVIGQGANQTIQTTGGQTVAYLTELTKALKEGPWLRH